MGRIDASPVFTTNIWENIFFGTCFFLLASKSRKSKDDGVQTPSFRKWGLEYDKQKKTGLHVFSNFALSW